MATEKAFEMSFMDEGHEIARTQKPFGVGSRASSVNHGDARNGRYGVMARHIFKQAQAHQWLEPPCDDDGNAMTELVTTRGVFLQRDNGSYVTYPHELHEEVVKAVLTLTNVPVAFTMSSEVIGALLNQLEPEQTHCSDPGMIGGVTLPIAPSVEAIASGKYVLDRNSQVCLCREQQFVLIWGETTEGILQHAQDVENFLIRLVWGSRMPLPPTPGSPMISATPNRFSMPGTPNRFSLAGTPHRLSMADSSLPLGYNTPMTAMMPALSEKQLEKLETIKAAIAREEEGDQAYDPEKDNKVQPRKLLLLHATVVGLAMVLVVVVEMACLAKLLQEVRLDGNYVRFALLATIPVFAFFAIFFMIVISGSFFQIFGPLSALQTNSMYYSGKAPKPAKYKDSYELPHVTIQMPVYKEGLKGVIMPTVESCMAAIRFYEERGGTASMYINDDGMQLISPELAEARQAYYELNNVGWCSRPKHCTEPGDHFFLRKGKFKKASNMNYCLDFSGRVEDEWIRLIAEECQKRGGSQADLDLATEEELYEQARETIINNDQERTWAAGNVRMGEVILIIDSDTRVPEDCLLYGALELHESPEVAILQHSSGVLSMNAGLFERGITYFTNLVYTSIQFAVGLGDCAPFVGHNSFLRWKALQTISWQDEETGKSLFWSESHVSEDFDVSLRLQMQGFVVRLATYHNGGFKEGVSLTVYDELARWEKYAYGCNELVFRPLKDWWRGPLTPLFRKFLFSNIKITSKVTIIAYIGTYYAIASAIPLTLANYLLLGWFSDEIDQFYINSWKIFVGMAVIFNIASPLAFAMLRHRLGSASFFRSLIDVLKWTPFFLLFFGGLSFHMCKAIGCHFLSISMEWTTTAKELEASGFRVGLDRVVRDFKYMYLMMIPLVGGMIYMAQFAPEDWMINDFTLIVPLANQVAFHMLLPFALGLF